LSHAMGEANRGAIARVSLTGREQIAVVRSVDGLLTLNLLNYASQIKKPDVFRDEIPEFKATKDEQRLARTLIDETSSDKVDLSQYRDTFTEKLTQLIEAKIAGREVVAPPEEEEVPVINLMDALRESVARAKAGSAGRPPRKVAPSRRPAASAGRKRKTS
jgi:DNA end-binding protein Ku